MFRKILLGLAALFVLVAAVVLYRTFTYGGASVGSRIDLPEPPAISAETAAEHLAEAIRFQTVTLVNGDPRPGTEGPWLDLQDWLQTTYPAAHAAMTREHVPGTLTLLYTWKGSDPSLKPLLLMAHQDVVPVNIGTEGDWTGAPFKGEIIDGYVYGRGALDDKSNLIGIMEAVDALAKTAVDQMGGLHVVVSNAGVTRDMLMMMMKPEMWDDVIRINLTAYFRLAKAALRTMTKQRFGRIIGVTSVVGVTGNAGQANYAASKAGMIGMTKSLAQEVASRNVTVNCIAPGFIATAMTDALNDAQKAAILGKIPAGEMGKSEDIAAAAVYLASEEAGYMTGQTLHVNGGMAMI